MAIGVECPECHKVFAAPDECAGLEDHCPACRTAVTIPPFQKSEIATPVEKFRSRIDWSSLIFPAQLATIVAAGITFVCTVHQRAPALNYLALIIGTGTAAYLSASKFFSTKWRWVAACVVGLIAVKGWGTNDYFVEHVVEQDDATMRKEATNYFYRSQRDWPFKREVWITFPDRYISVDGGYTDTGKKHGRWTFWDSTFPAGKATVEDWYWYGDKITEGEWHLRNDKR
jgi:phage FluMu protein Com